MIPRSNLSPIDQLQGRLLNLAALFLALFSLSLTLAPAARVRSWDFSYPWTHWLAFGVWLVVFNVAHHQSARWLPERDPFLLPVGALLSGWGMLTVWRLFPDFGLRQMVWLIAAGGILTAGLRLPTNLGFLRRYKYLWLTGGLALTGLTLIFGTNPMGFGPRMWLGCCGIYLQPSEPLKLLLIVYLAAYLADRVSIFPPSGTPLLPLLTPSLLMLGMALALLFIQRDLGTASIFLFLYAAIIFVTSGRRQVLIATGVVMLLAGVFGYLLFDLVQVRIDAWLNPWLDPSGRSYQIVQSLLAVANGGLLGRGPGMGSPGVVPVPHSDFIFTSIAEEMGLVGSLGLLMVIALLAARGLRAALRAPDSYRRYLAAGLVTFLVAQSALIIGGNVRLLPLTGVTLPFVSYGGSSLVTSFLSLLILMHISHQPENRPAPLLNPQPYLQLHVFLLGILGAAALVTGWWAVVRSPELTVRTDNPRRAIADRYVQRGAILDRDSETISSTSGAPGSYVRSILYPDLSNVIGYTHPVYGQAGLEASLDPYLRGLSGNRAPTIWWAHLLYGQPPPGLNIRLSLDLDLQRLVDEQFGERAGALVLVNASSGEILAMASHPGFNANELDANWETLVQDERAPLLNRATQGLYSPGAALGPWMLAEANSRTGQPRIPGELTYELDGRQMDCAIPVDMAELSTWPSTVARGCPGAVAELGRSLGSQVLIDVFSRLGLFSAPELRLPAASTVETPGPESDPANLALGQGWSVSPLQMALAAAALSQDGLRPAPLLVTGINHPETGWVLLTPLGRRVEAFSAEEAEGTALDLGALEPDSIWQTVASAPNQPDQTITWYLAATLPEFDGTPLALAVVLEEDDPAAAIQIGQAVIHAALQPAVVLSK